MNSQIRLPITTSLLAAALFADVSCAQSQPLAALPAAGSDSGTKTAAGYLVVYTDTENPISAGDIAYYPHTPYKIYDSRGALFRFVRNHASDRDESPTRVSLPPGRYTVVGRSETEGEVAVPVVVSISHTTVANLEKRAHGG